MKTVTKHIIRILFVCTLMVLCMFLPFLPGRYDSLAVTLSFMAQAFSLAGLLLVPLGVFWLWFEIGKRKRTPEIDRKTKRFSVATLLTLGFVILVASVGAFINYNLSFGILFLACCFTLLRRAYLKLKSQTVSGSLQFNPIPLYLLIIPIVAALVKFSFIEKGVQFSRDYAIRKSAPLITAIENYYAKNGNYPISLQAVHTDILPEVIGIRQYHYEPNGAAYNLYFWQFSDEFDVEEVVMYNKLDEHALSAHVLDILEYSGGELALRRGDRHRYRLSTPHWIYIKFE